MNICQGTGNTKGPKKQIRCERCGEVKSETAYRWTGTGLSRLCRKCLRQT